MSAHNLPLYALPAIGAEWPGQGGLFVGLRRNADGATVALIRAEPVQINVGWAAAIKWAKGLQLHGFADYRVPDRPESRLLLANAREELGLELYWTSEPDGGSYAWYQDFIYGNQTIDNRSAKLRAVAVRSFLLQSFNPSAVSA